MFTDKRIAEALGGAKEKRGLDVQVVVDKISVESRSSKINFLREKGVEVFVFNPQTKGKEMFRRKMHHKFALFDDDCVCSGSYNFTRQADKRNIENMNLLYDANACKQYEEEFNGLKKTCKKIKTVEEKSEKKVKGRVFKNKVMDMLRSIKNKFS
jgi:phosphatidylserine/phosphatidylglycerophosphate/cardiolipin synthase-like enzyme